MVTIEKGAFWSPSTMVGQLTKATFIILLCFRFVYISNSFDSSPVTRPGDLNMALRPNYSLGSKTRINRFIFGVSRYTT